MVVIALRKPGILTFSQICSANCVTTNFVARPCIRSELLYHPVSQLKPASGGEALGPANLSSKACDLFLVVRKTFTSLLIALPANNYPEDILIRWPERRLHMYRVKFHFVRSYSWSVWTLLTTLLANNYLADILWVMMVLESCGIVRLFTNPRSIFELYCASYLWVVVFLEFCGVVRLLVGEIDTWESRAFAEVSGVDDDHTNFIPWPESPMTNANALHALEILMTTGAS